MGRGVLVGDEQGLCLGQIEDYKLYSLWPKKKGKKMLLLEVINKQSGFHYYYYFKMFRHTNKTNFGVKSMT